MSPPLLTFLKYIFLAVLYLFFLRVLRAVWIELREPKVTIPDADGSSDFDAVFASAPPAREGAQVAAPAGVTTATGASGRPRLVVSAPAGSAGVSWPLNGETTVGRSPGCGISLPDDTFVSQLHARLFHRDGAWWVEDLGSTNGTFLDDARVGAPVVVHPGARVQFGQTVTELHP